LLNEDAVYCTTTYVVAECANALARVPARKHLTELVEGMEEAGGLLAPTEDEWQQAWTRYINGHSGSPGMVDHLSFLVMRRLGLSRVFTNDQHFFDEGFSPLF
jgi:predicted nucleic acid-binding protein